VALFLEILAIEPTGQTNWRMRRPLSSRLDPVPSPLPPPPVSRTGRSQGEGVSLVGWSKDHYESFEARGRSREANRSSEVVAVVVLLEINYYVTDLPPSLSR
jgi:hypothetical protein